MSQENVEIVRRVYESFARHEFPADALADDVCWETNPNLPDADIHRGVDAVRRYFRDWVGAWHEVENEVEELIDRGGEVVALVHGRFRLTPDARPFEADYAHIWTLRDGQVVYVKSTADRSAPELGDLTGLDRTETARCQEAEPQSRPPDLEE
jgi:ketosteroid isomerase-like protein